MMKKQGISNILTAILRSWNFLLCPKKICLAVLLHRERVLVESFSWEFKHFEQTFTTCLNCIIIYQLVYFNYLCLEMNLKLHVNIYINFRPKNY